MLALEIRGARKNYGDVRALRGVDLEVGEGEFFGLLGPNGAGKTTLIQSVVGLCRLDGGTVRVFGHDTVSDGLKARALIGYSPQEVNLDRFFSIEKILEFQAGFFGAPFSEARRIAAELLERFGLAAKAKTQYYKLSGGMQKRVLVAKALVGRPRLLILDEPTAGVDVGQRHELWEYLRKLNQDGTTIILTTHYIDEAEALCQRIGIIHGGEVRELGTPTQLIGKYCTSLVKIRTSGPLEKSWFRELKGFDVEVADNLVCASGQRPGVMTEKLLGVITRRENLFVDDIVVNRGDLEDVFLRVTGSSL